MGIKGLMKFLQDAAPKAIREVDSQAAYTGRVVAIDASMCLYQFLIMIRENRSGTYSNLTNEEGQVTSHIIGMLTRTIKLMESGIKPVYVFDGKPPELKLAELAARRAKRDEATDATTNETARWYGATMLKEVDARGRLHNQYVSECTGRPLNAHPFERRECAVDWATGAVLAFETKLAHVPNTTVHVVLGDRKAHV